MAGGKMMIELERINALEERITELENRNAEVEEHVVDIETMLMNMSNVNLAQMINMTSLLSALGRILVSKKIVTGEELVNISKEEFERLKADSEAFKDEVLKSMEENKEEAQASTDGQSDQSKGE